MTEYIDISLPNKMNIERKGKQLVITKRWFGSSTLFFFLALMVFLWATIDELFYFSWNYFSFYEYMLAFLALLGSYYVVADCINQTRIIVSRWQVQVTHGPLPLVKGTRVNINDIKQLYCKQVSTNTENSSYEVHVIAHSGKDVPLIVGLESSQQAIYIEQEIEKCLGIENKPVRGEL